jgi:hypothetical protein
MLRKKSYMAFVASNIQIAEIERERKTITGKKSWQTTLSLSLT